MLIQELANQISSYLPDVSQGVKTSAGIAHPSADGIVFGNPNQECTGIVVTCYISIEVIAKTRELGANLIVTHEGTFYGVYDHPEWLEGNPVYTEKVRRLNEANIVILRIHDAMHMYPQNRDWIFYGIAQSLGWMPYLIQDEKRPYLFRLPAMPAAKFVEQLMEQFNLNGIRVVGNMEKSVSTVLFGLHYYGMFPTEQVDKQRILQLEDIKPDVIIPGEIVDYTITEYCRDANSLGNGPLLLEMGHFNWEELGMMYAKNWISESTQGAAPVYAVQSGDFFKYIVKS